MGHGAGLLSREPQYAPGPSQRAATVAGQLPSLCPGCIELLLTSIEVGSCALPACGEEVPLTLRLSSTSVLPGCSASSTSGMPGLPAASVPKLSECAPLPPARQHGKPPGVSKSAAGVRSSIESSKTGDSGGSNGRRLWARSRPPQDKCKHGPAASPHL